MFRLDQNVKANRQLLQLNLGESCGKQDIFIRLAKSQQILCSFAHHLLTTLPRNTPATLLAASIAILFVDVSAIRRKI